MTIISEDTAGLWSGALSGDRDARSDVLLADPVNGALCRRSTRRG